MRRSAGATVATGAILGFLTATAQGCSSDGTGQADANTSKLYVGCSTSSDGCTCRAAKRTEPPPTLECSAAALAGTLCCAGSGYPATEYTSCSCAKPRPYKCFSYRKFQYDTCLCAQQDSITDPYASNIKEQPSCSPLPATGGGLGTCCQSGDECWCSDSSSCPGGVKAVPVCTIPAPTCTSGTQVTSCSAGTGTAGAGGSGAGGSGAGGSCNLKAENWYTDCTKGCGDVMTCQTFCSSCKPTCYVACSSDADCAAVGAGSCETATKGTNRCSSAPTKCR